MGNITSKRTWIVLGVVFLLSALARLVPAILNVVFASLIICIFYNSFIKVKLNKSKYKGEELYRLKSKVKYSNILGYIFILVFFIYDMISTYEYIYIDGQHTQVYSVNDMKSEQWIALIIIAIIYIILIFIEIRAGKNNTILYDKGIMTSFGEFIKYEDIAEINRKEFDIKGVYKLKVKGYTGSVEFFEELDKEYKVQEILRNKIENLF
ncbi:hypothetical protein [Clostridium sp.]|uniref:hypothetical protein n=1 Tax=Clostridium sp. TaxID=1506 RepID=UPI002FCA9CAF